MQKARHTLLLFLSLVVMTSPALVAAEINQDTGADRKKSAKITSLVSRDEHDSDSSDVRHKKHHHHHYEDDLISDTAGLALNLFSLATSKWGKSIGTSGPVLTVEGTWAPLSFYSRVYSSDPDEDSSSSARFTMGMWNAAVKLELLLRNGFTIGAKGSFGPNQEHAAAGFGAYGFWGYEMELNDPRNDPYAVLDPLSGVPLSMEKGDFTHVGIRVENGYGAKMAGGVGSSDDDWEFAFYFSVGPVVQFNSRSRFAVSIIYDYINNVEYKSASSAGQLGLVCGLGFSLGK